jgi:hypothetical protein
MRHAISFALCVAGLLVASASGAQSGLSMERSGLGLRPAAADQSFGGEAVQIWQARRSSEFMLYGGARETIGLSPAESYAGVVYALPRGWGSSFEAGQVLESPGLPRSFALTGQLHSPLSEGRTVSVGIKYRIYDVDSRFGPAAPDPGIANGYTLNPYRAPGAAFAPGYQLQLNYQYSTASAFGLALGRDVETFTPYYDTPGSGPRQFSFTGQHWLTPSWALSYDVLSQDAQAPLKSMGLRLGMRYRW